MSLKVLTRSIASMVCFHGGDLGKRDWIQWFGAGVYELVLGGVLCFWVWLGAVVHVEVLEGIDLEEAVGIDCDKDCLSGRSLDPLRLLSGGSGDVEVVEDGVVDIGVISTWCDGYISCFDDGFDSSELVVVDCCVMGL